MALLVLAAAAGCSVLAIHVDHGLRPGSDQEGVIVEAAAHRFGARFRGERVTVESGSNLEARARTARYRVLPDDVMTGHTLDDLAETMLLNLLRGAGIDGMSPFRQAGGVQRPLLALRRADTEHLCEVLGLETVDDPSNRDPRFRRNRVRHELLPLMGDIAERDVAVVLARQAELFADEVAVLDELASALDPTDARVLAAASPALARRSLRGWLREVGGGNPPDSDALERVLSVARGEARAAEIAGGVRIARSHGRLFVER